MRRRGAARVRGSLRGCGRKQVEQAQLRGLSCLERRSQQALPCVRYSPTPRAVTAVAQYGGKLALRSSVVNCAHEA